MQNAGKQTRGFCMQIRQKIYRKSEHLGNSHPVKPGGEQSGDHYYYYYLSYHYHYYYYRPHHPLCLPTAVHRVRCQLCQGGPMGTLTFPAPIAPPLEAGPQDLQKMAEKTLAGLKN